MVLKKPNEDNNLFHLSYDKINEKEDSEKLRTQIIYLILGVDINADLKTPVASTLLIETLLEYKDFVSKITEWNQNKIYFAFSEVKQDEVYFFIETNFNEELNNTFVKKVKDIKLEILRNKKLSEY